MVQKRHSIFNPHWRDNGVLGWRDGFGGEGSRNTRIGPTHKSNMNEEDQMTLKRRSIKLSPTDWQQLQDIAAATGSLATKGIRVGQPTWRALIRRIAQKELEVYELREFTKDMIGGNLDVEAPINFFENLGMPSTAGMVSTGNPCPWCGKDFGWIMASCGTGTTWSLYKCPECEKFIARGWAIPDAVREDPDTKIMETEPIGTDALVV